MSPIGKVLLFVFTWRKKLHLDSRTLLVFVCFAGYVVYVYVY